MRFVHIVNPFDPGPSEKEKRLQKLTFDALFNAAKTAEGIDEVKICAAYFKEDETAFPIEIIRVKQLERSLSDVSGIAMKKKLPLMADILDGLKKFPEADYYIYTNMDIIPAPQFYSAIAQILKVEKHQALIINRRRVEESLLDSPEKIFTQDGLPHPGYDCFVFHRSLLDQLEFGNAAVGVPGIGFLFAHNLFLRTDSCAVLTDKHLTYHLGMEIVKPWTEKSVVEYQYDIIRNFLKKHRNEFTVKNFPGYTLPFFKRHYRWLMSPLFSYPMMFRLDMRGLFDGRTIQQKEDAGFSWKELNFVKTHAG
ncbi:MAG TPA: hypothetical protein VL651_14175 [Bacteroidia bacterium]|jgi:hypothetical protein|nr:hypothetical protein [Bacteroidia bacterium]